MNAFVKSPFRPDGPPINWRSWTVAAVAAGLASKILLAGAILLISPIVPSAIGFQEAEAHAQDCTDSDGDPRECTDSEDYAICLANVVDALDQCLEANAGRGLIRGANRLGCRALAAIDALGCAIQYLIDVLGPTE